MNKPKTNVFSMILYVGLSLGAFLIVDKLSVYATDLFLKGSFKYTWLSVHHLIQLALVLLIMIVPFWNKSLKDWGLNFGNKDKTLKIIKTFTIGWVIFSLLYIVISSWLSGWPHLIDFDFTPAKCALYLIFESVIVGVSEEILFRGLVYGILIRKFDRKIGMPGFTISSAGVITALIFAIAHIGIQMSPFAVTVFNPMQVLVAFVLGIFYAVILEKTGSLLGPVLAHCITDGWLSFLYIAMYILTGGK